MADARDERMQVARSRAAGLQQLDTWTRWLQTNASQPLERHRLGFIRLCVKHIRSASPQTLEGMLNEFYGVTPVYLSSAMTVHVRLCTTTIKDTTMRRCVAHDVIVQMDFVNLSTRQCLADIAAVLEEAFEVSPPLSDAEALGPLYKFVCGRTHPVVHAMPCPWCPTPDALHGATPFDVCIDIK